MNYRNHFSSRQTPQSQPIPGENMVKNNAGGYTFAVDMWTQLERFLILGSEGGTYYVGKRELTVENGENVVACVSADGLRAVKIITEISHSGRAPKNDPALFALAIAAGLGDDATRRAAFEALPQVARIGTHILMFVDFMEAFRGWGRAAKRGVGGWFTAQTPDRLAYQFLKYNQRGGWSMRDVLRLTHPAATSPEQNALFNYIVKGEPNSETEQLLPRQILAARSISEGLNPKQQKDVQRVRDCVLEYNLTREMIPTEFLNSPEVWDALLQRMPLGAMIRSLGKMGSIGLIAPMSDAANLVCTKLREEENLRHARIHPINVLAASLVYQRGQGIKGNNSWTVVPQVVDALNDAFYGSFKTLEPSGKKTLIGLDVSGSMTGHSVNGMDFMDARTAAAAMSMATVRLESQWHVMGFTGEFIQIPLSPRQSLQEIVKTTSGLPFGRTDCSLPMRWALANKVPVETFVIYTDNETWWGDVHPVQALRDYREKMGIPAKLVTCAMTATKFSIAQSGRSGTFHHFDPAAVADPNDAGMLDVAGLDSNAPAVIADFSRN